jgi:hypothetical protein
LENPRREPNLFRSDRYLASHGDLILAYASITDYAAKVEAASNHYLFAGRNEPGRQITFSPEAYLNAHPDVKAFYGNDLAAATHHYIVSGFNEGRAVA